MKAVLITGSVLAGIALLAGCSERNVTTAPSTTATAPSPAGFIGDRPYTWTLKCSGDLFSQANWSWTANGVVIPGTEASATCYPTLSPASSASVRPAAADGFSACVNGNGVYAGACKQWRFDPAGPFQTHLKGTISQFDFLLCDPFGHINQKCYQTATATLTVDS